MADDVENHTLRLLQEMREMRTDLTGRIDELSNSLNGNTAILNMIAGFVHDHEQRIEGLEAARS